MAEGNNIVCRLCLGVSQKGMPIDETARQMLDILLVNMNFGVSDNPSMCEKCAEIIKKSLHFILKCLDSERTILLFGIGGNNTDIDLRAIYESISNEMIDGDDAICRFCIRKVEENRFIPLDILMEENTFSNNVKRYMFQMDLNITKSSPICLNCQDNMESYFKFLGNCLDTEDKINKYRQNNGIISGEKILLNNVFKSFFKCMKEKEKCNLITEIKEEFDIEDNVIDFLPYQNKEPGSHIPCTCDKKDSSCSRCPGKLKNAAPDGKYIKVETAPSEVSNQPSKLETEKSEVQLYRCDSCRYQGKRKDYLRKHLLTHKKDSDLQVHRCDSCEFQTNQKQSLRKHLLALNHVSKVPVYQCDSCDYHTKRKANLKRHLLTHKDFSEVQTYHCDSCEFQTKHKKNLNTHLLTHKDFSEVQTYKCDSCEYQTKFKDYLKTHLLIHKDFSKVLTYQCDSCEYHTKFKKNLNRHLLTHKHDCDVQVHRCDSCKFQTRHKDSLKRHQLSHNNFSNK